MTIIENKLFFVCNFSLSYLLNNFYYDFVLLINIKILFLELFKSRRDGGWVQSSY